MTTAAPVRAGRNTRSGTEWLRRQAKNVGDGEPLAVGTEIADAVGVEAWLQSRGVRYAPPGPIPMELIDEKRSRANQARRDPIVPESVDRFTIAMKAGAVFPPIVAYPDGGKLVIIDGNNRHASTRRAALPVINGIVLAEDTPSEIIHLLTVEANARHGVTPELGWRIHQAFSLCAIGWNDTEAADAAGLSVAQLRNARAVQDADQRARSLRVPGFATLPASSKVALVGTRDEAVFSRLARVAVETAMTTDEIREVTRALRQLPSEAARVDHVNQVAKTRTIQKSVRRTENKHSRVHSPKMALSAGIGRMMAVDPAALVKQIVTAAERDQVIARIGEAKKKLALLEATMAALSIEA